MPDTRLASNTGIYPTSLLMGCDVETPGGQFLGRIEDFVIDLGESFVAAAVLACPAGGPAPSDKRVAVPVYALGYDPAQKKCILNLSKELLHHAPPLPRDESVEGLDRSWAADLYAYYGGVPYWF